MIAIFPTAVLIAIGSMALGVVAAMLGLRRALARAGLLLACLFALPAQAQPDAPVAAPPEVAAVVLPDDPYTLAEGKPAPFAGILVTEKSFIAVTRRLVAAEARVKVYERQPPTPVIVVAVVITAVVVGATAAGVTYAAVTSRQKP